MKHTPGPWVQVNRGRKGYFICNGDLRIAKIPTLREYGKRTSTDLDQECANTRLIAAAPDAYKILDTINAILTSYPDGRHVNWPSVKAGIEEYIAKAEGREE